MRRGALIGAVVSFVASSLACGSQAPEVATVRALETEDPRFEMHLDSSIPATANGSRELRLRLLPKKGWHMEPDAPTTLTLTGSAGVELLAPDQDIEDAVQGTEEQIEFAVAYRPVEGSAGTGADPTASGRLKFGVCRDGNSRCEIVQRKLEIPLVR